VCSNHFNEHVCSSGKNYLDGQWHFVVQQMKNGSGSSVFVDGQLVGTGTIDYSQTYAVGHMRLYANASSWPMSVRFDNFRYYNRVLSAQELETLRNESFAPSCSDEILNQNETEIDYGGVCGKTPSDGLVAHYSFDGSMLDDGPYANNLPRPLNASFLPGIRESSLAFSGIAYSPSLAISSGSTSFQFSTGMTIAAWVRLDTNKQGTIISRVNGNDGGMMFGINRLSVDSFQIYGQINPWTTALSYSFSNVSQNPWAHVVMTTDGKKLSLYYNGERALSQPSFNDLHPPLAGFSNANKLLVGEGWRAASMNGQLDEMYFYNRALSPDEIRRLYVGSSRAPDHLTLSSSSPAVGSLDVARLSPLRLEFASPVDPATIAGNVSLQVGGTAVPAVATLETERSIRIRTIPLETLAANTDYTVLVGTGLANVAGDRLSAPISVSFRTGTRTIDVGGLYDPLRSLFSGSIPDWDAWETSQKHNLALSETPEQRAAAGDPVDLRTGEFTYENTLMRLPGIGLPYTLSISYRSRIEREGILGHGWSASHEQRVEERPDGTAVYYDERFGMHEFARTGTGVYEYSPSYRARLAKTATGFDLSFDDRTGMSFTLSGALASIRDANNNTITFARDPAGRISAATDTLGHVIDYAYTASGRLASVTASGVSAVAFEYSDGSGTGSVA
jgi:YD repeat-containing protein